MWLEFWSLFFPSAGNDSVLITVDSGKSPYHNRPVSWFDRDQAIMCSPSLHSGL